MWLEGISKTISRTGRSNQVKIASKIDASNRKQKNFYGMFQVLAPGSTVGKVSPTTSVIKGPNNLEVRVRNANIAKHGTKHERDKELVHEQSEGHTKIKEKTLGQKILNHEKEFFRENLGSK